MNIGRTYEELMPHYRAFLMLERGLSDNTRVAYMADVARLADWASQISTPIADLTSDDLHAFVAEIHSRRGRAYAGQDSVGCALFLPLSCGGRCGGSEPRGAYRKPKPGLHLPEVLTVEEVQRMFDAIDVTAPLGRRNRAMLEVLYGSGLRVSELCSLERRRVFLDKAYLIVEEKAPRSVWCP